MATPSQYPVRPISRVNLTLLLLAISLIPPIFVISMVATHVPPPEPLLDAAVRQEVTVFTPRKSPNKPRILPCLIVENPTQVEWRNVAVSLNKEFFYYHPGTLTAGQSFTTPLEFFVTKGGNVAFQPGSESVRRATIFAQIPSGARAVSEYVFDQDGIAKREVKRSRKSE